MAGKTWRSTDTSESNETSNSATEGNKEIVAPTEHNEYPHGAMLAVIVMALILTVTMVALDMTIVATAIPHITDEFQSLDQVGWYGSAFLMTLATFQSTWGKLYKYSNLKSAFLLSGVIFEVGSLLCATAPNSEALIIGRAIAGTGAAGMVGGCYIIIAFIAPPHETPVYIGLLGTTYGTMSVVGPLLGGVFTDKATWRWCFYINLPVGVPALAIIGLVFRPPAHAKPTSASWREVLLQLDLLGAAILIGALICFLLDMQWGGTSKSWGSAEVVCLLVGWGLLMTLFGLVQWYQGERASLVPRILKQRVVAGVSLFIFFLSGANFLLQYYIPIYFQAIAGMSAARSGISNLPFIVLSSAFGAISGIAITRIGYYTIFLATGSIIFTIGAAFIYTLDIGSPSSHYLGYQVMLGVGLGVAVQIPVITAQAFSEPGDIAAVTAIVLWFQLMGGTVFVSCAQAVFTNRLLAALSIYAPHVSAETVLAVGAPDLQGHFSEETLQGVLKSYMTGLKAAFILGTVLCGCAFLSVWVAPIKSLKKKATTTMVE
ncbi:major facilitator superfamily domain-containing protein [Aspergillus parasiticus]|uniref:Major facilitator superfamily domain-containing protein n=1 Tax=Aspergillus parasiticus TaxID=5067 RepID=A0A5N6DBR7_ASPPA|nr:major facilitator superfamily domain-containing protein [Aspergillus parasiticus]